MFQRYNVQKLAFDRWNFRHLFLGFSGQASANSLLKSASLNLAKASPA
jgi:hypothetical protein